MSESFLLFFHGLNLVLLISMLCLLVYLLGRGDGNGTA